MTKNKYDKAFNALCRFRNSKLQAARDVYYIHKLLEVENEMKEGKSLIKEFFVRPRNRRAAQSSFFVMFMQQFCGVNVSYSKNLCTAYTLLQVNELVSETVVFDQPSMMDHLDDRQSQQTYLKAQTHTWVAIPMVY